MSLLEKAKKGAKTESSSLAGTSLFSRAMAATREEAHAEPPLAPTPAGASLKSRVSAIPSEPSTPILGVDLADELRSKLRALHPFHDSVFAAWSLLADRLPLQALALLLPRGEFLIPAAQFGFPSIRCEELPGTIAKPEQPDGELLGEEACAILAPALGVGSSIPLRGVASSGSSGGLWVFHDDRCESSSASSRRGISELLSEALASWPGFPMADLVPDPARKALHALSKYPFATVFRFEISPEFADSSSCRGVCSLSLASAYSSAAQRILDQTGVAFAYSDAHFAGLLGTSARIDPELSLFQFSKTLRKSLPFISAEAFPSGSALSVELSSEAVLSELARFLAV